MLLLIPETETVKPCAAGRTLTAVVFCCHHSPRRVTDTAAALRLAAEDCTRTTTSQGMIN